MHQTKKTSYIGFEDLLREMSALEQQILPENSSLAMDLMTLEAKIRDRFQKYQLKVGENPDPFDDLLIPFNNQLTYDEIRALIPQDLTLFEAMDRVDTQSCKKKRIWETVGVAIFLAVTTALGIFGLASMLQYLLNWIA